MASEPESEAQQRNIEAGATLLVKFANAVGYSREQLVDLLACADRAMESVEESDPLVVLEDDLDAHSLAVGFAIAIKLYPLAIEVAAQKPFMDQMIKGAKHN